jgi:hypothetical protein
MTSTRLIALATALFFGGMLAWGLKTGVMPEKQVDIDRRYHPVLFRVAAAIYAFLCLFSLYLLYVG